MYKTNKYIRIKFRFCREYAVEYIEEMNINQF